MRCIGEKRGVDGFPRNALCGCGSGFRFGFSAILQHGVADAGKKKGREDSCVLPRGADAGFDQPPEVDDRRYGCNVDEAVETLPVLASHGSQHERRRRDGEEEEKEPGEDANLNEAALQQVVEDGGPDLFPLGDEFVGMTDAEARDRHREIVAGEEEDVGGEVERRIEKSVEADQTPEADEPRDLRGEAADGRDGEAGEENVESPIAGEVRDVIDGVGVKGERAREVEAQQPRERREAQEMDKDFEGEDGTLGHGDLGKVSLACGEDVSV